MEKTIHSGDSILTSVIFCDIYTVALSLSPGHRVRNSDVNSITMTTFIYIYTTTIIINYYPYTFLCICQAFGEPLA